MKRTTILLLILAIMSTMVFNGHAFAADENANVSIGETIDDPAATPEDIIVINQDAKIVNITENSNETTVIDTVIGEEEKKYSPGFSLTDNMLSLIAAIIVIIMSMVAIRKNK